MCNEIVLKSRNLGMHLIRKFQISYIYSDYFWYNVFIEEMVLIVQFFFSKSNRIVNYPHRKMRPSNVFIMSNIKSYYFSYSQICLLTIVLLVEIADLKSCVLNMYYIISTNHHKISLLASIEYRDTYK